MSIYRYIILKLHCIFFPPCFCFYITFISAFPIAGGHSTCVVCDILHFGSGICLYNQLASLFSRVEVRIYGSVLGSIQVVAIKVISILSTIATLFFLCFLKARIFLTGESNFLFCIIYFYYICQFILLLFSLLIKLICVSSDSSEHHQNCCVFYPLCTFTFFMIMLLLSIPKKNDDQ